MSDLTARPRSSAPAGAWDAGSPAPSPGLAPGWSRRHATGTLLVSGMVKARAAVCFAVFGDVGWAFGVRLGLTAYR